MQLIFLNFHKKKYFKSEIFTSNIFFYSETSTLLKRTNLHVETISTYSYNTKNTNIFSQMKNTPSCHRIRITQHALCVINSSISPNNGYAATNVRVPHCKF